MKTSIALVLMALAAAPVVAAPAYPPETEQGPKPAVRAKKAMASTNNAMVTKAMLDVMKKGGNALDAALVGVIMQPVVEPQMTTIAGAMSLLYYEAKTGKYYYLDAELDHTRKGAMISTGWVAMTNGERGAEETSGRTIAVPGTVAGLKAAADRFGTLKWADYFQPAIAVAEKGFPQYSFLYGEMAEAALGRLSAYPSGRAEFLPDGYVPPVGTIMKRPRLAATMRKLAAEGPAYFYTGEWAQHFVAASRSIGSEITMQDLADYKVRWEEPTRTTYKNYEIIGAPPPSTAGTLISMIMNVLEPFDLKAEPHYSQSAPAFEKVRRAFAFAENSTDQYIRDPLSYDVPLDLLLSKENAALESKKIAGSLARPLPATAMVVPPSKVEIAADFSVKDPHSTDTDQIVAIDAEGNMVSVTHSVDGSTFASGLVVDGVVVNGGNGFPGTGNGEGRRTISPFDPTMIAKDGKPVMTIGSPGLASRAVAFTLINYLGYGLPLDQAVDAARFMGSDPRNPTVIESRVSQNVLDTLKMTYGLKVRQTAGYNWHFGSVHAIAREPDGSLVGVADPRRVGVADGY
jgi:gamma-glutamyltranspeptidase/glutathione hydrolase